MHKIVDLRAASNTRRSHRAGIHASVRTNVHVVAYLNAANVRMRNPRAVRSLPVPEPRGTDYSARQDTTTRPYTYAWPDEHARPDIRVRPDDRGLVNPT